MQVDQDHYFIGMENIFKEHFLNTVSFLYYVIKAKLINYVTIKMTYWMLSRDNNNVIVKWRLSKSL